jgi:hypothetical protein
MQAGDHLRPLKMLLNCPTYYFFCRLGLLQNPGHIKLVHFHSASAHNLISQAAVIVRELMGRVRNVVLINVYLDLENPGGSGFWVRGYMSQVREWGS